jgi:hypothetical protein
VTHPSQYWILLIVCLVIVAGYSIYNSYYNGWMELSTFYRSKDEFRGIKYAEFWIHSSVSINLTGLAPLVIFGANSEGLYIVVPLILRLTHPPLFIPWNEISIIESYVGKSKQYKLQITKAPNVSLFISQRVGNKLAKNAGSSWPPVGMSF